MTLISALLKRSRFIFQTALMTAGLAVLAGCHSTAATLPAETWVGLKTMDQEMRAEFQHALDAHPPKDAVYTPVLAAKQIVDGQNYYRFICVAENKQTPPTFGIVEWLVSADEKSVAKPAPAGLLTDHYKPNIPGGWMPMSPVNDDAKDVFRRIAAKLPGANKYEPLLYSAQVVAGMNWRFVCVESSSIPTAQDAAIPADLVQVTAYINLQNAVTEPAVKSMAK